jgi:phytanoyl-CoA hydroxylase
MTEPAITPEQRSFYEAHGYLLLERFFSPTELARCATRFSAIVRGDVAPAEGMLVMRDVMVAKGAVRPTDRESEIAKIQDFHGDPLLFDAYVRHPGLLDVVEQFTGPDITSIHTMLINKPPGVDGRHPLHQDLLYFPFRPADGIVATWTAMERCSRENGCLVVLPGSHKGELLAHENMDWEYVNTAYFGAAGVGEASERLHLEMQAGDTVLFHPLLIHGSGRNRSNGFRRAISAHYASAASRYLPGSQPIGGVRPYTLVRGTSHADGI